MNPSSSSNESPKITRRRSFSNPFSKTKKVSDPEIKPTGHGITTRLEKPFRFAPHVNFANNGLLAFVDLCSDEEIFQAEMKKLLEILYPFMQESRASIVQVIDSLQNLILVTRKLEINDSVQETIVSKVQDIVDAYNAYRINYFRMVNELSDSEVSPELAFAFDGIKDGLLKPFQRLLEYRFFLRKVLKCDQHVCQNINCNSKDCATKLENDKINRKATANLTKLVKSCCDDFGMKDYYDDLIAWEDLLEVNECCGIGPDEGKMNLDLHLSAPYLQKSYPMAELPHHLFSAAYQAFPIQADSKIASFDKNRLNISFSNSKARILDLNLFSDTLMITGEAFQGKKPLLYPPMPLTHISLELHLESTKAPVYCLKISPFQMLLLKPHDPSAGSHLLELLLNYQSERKPSAVSNPVILAPKASMKRKNSIIYAPTLYRLCRDVKSPDDEPKHDDKERVIFESLCRPHIWKPASEGTADYEWSKLSKCVLSLRLIDGKPLIFLAAEGTSRSILNAKIEPSIDFSQVSSKRLQLTIVDCDLLVKTFLIQLGSPEIFQQFIRHLEQLVQLGLYEKFKSYKNLLNLEPAPQLSNQSFEIKTKELTTHLQVMLSQNEQLINFGPAESFIVVLGKAVESTRLVVQSTINPAISILELDLGSSKWSIRTDENTAIIIRLFKEQAYTDYRLVLDPKCISSFVSDIELIGKEAKFIHEIVEKRKKQDEELEKLETNFKEFELLKEKPIVVDADSEASLVDRAISTSALDLENLDSTKSVDVSMKPVDSSASLVASQKSIIFGPEKDSKTLDIELDALRKEYRAQEKEIHILYDTFTQYLSERQNIKEILSSRSKNC